MCRIFCFLISIAGYLSCLAKHDPGCISFDYTVLVENRQRIQEGDENYKVIYEKLLTRADSLLTKEPLKVIDGDIPPTGDPRDFYTIGKFSWRNPDTPDGMPYIRGDGRYNEEAFGDRFDLTRFQQTLNAINTLSLTWFYSNEE